MTSGQSKTATT